jgi:cyclohexanone monooxygenase
MTHLTLDELNARYRAERQKRLRPEGLAQYADIRKLDGDLDRDPYVESPLVRDAISEEVDTVIIGAGLGGLQTAVRLAQQGVSKVRIIDKAADFGGTWYWNRYPGAACDVESYIYMPLLEETGYIPSEKYAKATEIFTHCQRIASTFNLYPSALFQTNVTELRWLDASSRWQVNTDRGDRLLARFVVVAGGILHRAKLPRIPGVETFRGTSFHTSRWNYDYTGGSPTQPLAKLADKRVALIGTGATSVQVFPRLAQSAKHVYLCQRTPSAVGLPPV